jgi:hypothetical protein
MIQLPDSRPAARVETDPEEHGTSVPSVDQRKEETMTSEPGVERPSRLAREDLARRLGLKPESVKVVSVEEVDWRDTSLGCPKPGMMYAQVITPGFRVVLKAGGKTYEYHTDRGSQVILCDG